MHGSTEFGDSEVRNEKALERREQQECDTDLKKPVALTRQQSSRFHVTAL
jgi:hypothetical protein